MTITSAIPGIDLDAGAREALRLLGPMPDNWVPRHAGVDHDVVVVGGGQNGCAYAFALRRAGIARVRVIDAAPGPAQAGAWRTRARMHTLRTAKRLVGPELDVSALGFQAWYEARHGRAAYEALDRIPRVSWADYLAWYRVFLGIDVAYGTRLTGIEPVAGAAVPLLRLHLLVGGQPHTETTRKLVLATGVDGAGAPVMPPWLAPAATAGLATHTGETIDFDSLHGRTVAVLGAGASAFDAAATALEAGATRVHLFCRRAALPARPLGKTRGYPGIYDSYPDLPDALRWGQALRARRAGANPPADAVRRAVAHPGFRLHLGAPWRTAEVAGDEVVVDVGESPMRFHHVIAGTGYSSDPGQRPELAALAPLVLRWRDRYQPPAGDDDDALGAAPYLGTGLELLEREPGTAPWLAQIHLHNPGGFVSRGAPLGDVPSMRRDIPAVIRRLSRDLLLADLPSHQTRIDGDVEPDFASGLYEAALGRHDALL